MFGEFDEEIVAEGLANTFEKFNVNVLPFKNAIAIWARTTNAVREPFYGKVLTVEFRPDEPSKMKIRFFCIYI